MIKRLARFSIRDVLYVTTIVALVLALWITSQKVPRAVRPGGFAAGGPQTTIEGPLLVTYREQTSPNSTSGSKDVRMQALHFCDDYVVFEYQGGRYRRVQSSRLVELSWRAGE